MIKIHQHFNTQIIMSGDDTKINKRLVALEEALKVANEKIAEQRRDINKLKKDLNAEKEKRAQTGRPVPAPRRDIDVIISLIRKRAKEYPSRGKETAEAIVRCLRPFGRVFLADLKRDAHGWLDVNEVDRTLSANLQKLAHRAELNGCLPILESFARGHKQTDLNGYVFYTIHRDIMPK